MTKMDLAQHIAPSSRPSSVRMSRAPPRLDRTIPLSDSLRQGSILGSDYLNPGFGGAQGRGARKQAERKGFRFGPRRSVSWARRASGGLERPSSRPWHRSLFTRDICKEPPGQACARRLPQRLCPSKPPPSSDAGLLVPNRSSLSLSFSSCPEDAR